MRFALLVSLLAFVPLIGCRREDNNAAAANAPPAQVTVAHPIQHEVIDWDEYSGRLEAPESVELRARVSGQIVEANFQEGTIIKQGDVLFVIDPRPYQAALNSALADIARAQAQLNEANTQLARVRGAVNAVSEQEITSAQAAAQSAKAALQSAEANRDQQQLNLDWCKVTAPIGGRVGRKLVTPGNIITGGQASGTLLTTIVSIDPMFCYVDVDERSVLKYQRLAAEKKRVSAREARVPAFLQLANETTFPHEGYIDFVDNRVDPQTGTLRARGVFPNPTGALTPGFSATMRVPGSGRYIATLIPATAVVTQQNLKLLMTVDEQDIVQPRPVVLGTLFGDLQAIDSGVTPQERVIINGLLRARPGAKVQPTVGTFSIAKAMSQQTAPGSPTTQALPTTRNVMSSPTTASMGGAR
jgi:RND family efflux transporter MFP subunit